MTIFFAKSGKKMGSFSSETTQCCIQGTEVDVLNDLVAGASSSPRPFAFTFLGEEFLASAKPS